MTRNDKLGDDSNNDEESEGVLENEPHSFRASVVEQRSPEQDWCEIPCKERF